MAHFQSSCYFQRVWIVALINNTGVMPEYQNETENTINNVCEYINFQLQFLWAGIVTMPHKETDFANPANECLIT